MKNFFKKLLFLFIALILFSTTAQALSGDMSINSQDISFSSNTFLEGRTIRIYAATVNNSNQDLLGVVRFFDNGSQIGGDQAISIYVGRPDDVFVDWTPSYGQHRIAVKLYPFEPENDDPNNNWVVTDVFVAQDTDHDGITNLQDPDDDNDGVSDEKDAYPLNSKEQYDTDGDGTGDNADTDDDNDEVPDKFDDLPLDPNETIDTDKDGIGNIADTDDDNDGISDNEEENTGTDALKADTDNDGSNDKDDAFPLDQGEWLDTDKDNIGNNTDIDDDNDGTPDIKDEYPLNKGPVIEIKEEDSLVGLYEEQIFDASSSYDEDGKIVSYVWAIDDKDLKEGNSTNYTFKEKGKHNVKLSITDDSGESRTKEFQVNVINFRFYKQLAATIIAILLAMLIFFKYIATAKNKPKT